ADAPKAGAKRNKPTPRVSGRKRAGRIYPWGEKCWNWAGRLSRVQTGLHGASMTVLLGFSRVVDWVNAQIAIIANCLVLLACLISAGNAFSRYLFSESSNGWLEIQWYMFAGMVLLGAPYTLKVNEHVRVDLLYGMMSPRKRIWIDIIGGVLFLLPICIILTY